LARNVRKTLEICEKIEVEFVASGGKLDPLQLAIYGTVAQMELINITERNHASMTTRKKRNVAKGLPENHNIGNDNFKGANNAWGIKGRAAGTAQMKAKAAAKHSNTVEIMKLLFKDYGYKLTRFSRDLAANFGIIDQRTKKPFTTATLHRLFKRYIAGEPTNVNAEQLGIVPRGFTVKEYAENHTAHYVTDLHAKGYTTGQIAKHLNGNFVKTARGAKFYAETVSRLLDKKE
jgi:hypothetical protein